MQGKTELPQINKSEVTSDKQPMFYKGARVQYVGALAFSGMSGEVVGYRESDVLVRFDGLPNIATIPEADLVSAGDEFSVDKNAIMTSKHPRARFVCNTSGGLLIIPDLINAANEAGIALEKGEILDLLQYFTPEQINGSRGLMSALKTVSDTTKLMQLTLVDSYDSPVPEGAIVKTLSELHSAGTTIEAPRNIYFDRLEEENDKELDRTERMLPLSAKRRTAQHGKASKGLGR